MRGGSVFVVGVVATLVEPAPADTRAPDGPQPDRAAVAEADLLWPLTRPPDASPHAPLLSWFGQPWPALCAATPIAGTPAEAKDYAAAWCRPPDQIADALYALLGHSSAGYRAAIRADLVDVLAADNLPGTAQLWLEAHHLRELAGARARRRGRART